jgi:hypothetical protein
VSGNTVVASSTSVVAADATLSVKASQASTFTGSVLRAASSPGANLLYLQRGVVDVMKVSEPDQFAHVFRAPPPRLVLHVFSGLIQETVTAYVCTASAL